MSRQLLGDLAYPASACRFFFPGLEFFGVLIRKADLLVEIFLDELKSFPAVPEEDVVKFRDCRARAQRLEQIPRIDRSHICPGLLFGANPNTSNDCITNV